MAIVSLFAKSMYPADFEKIRDLKEFKNTPLRGTELLARRIFQPTISATRLVGGRLHKLG